MYFDISLAKNVTTTLGLSLVLPSTPFVWFLPSSHAQTTPPSPFWTELQVLCGVCSPYSAHLYTRLAEMGDDGLAMTRDFCDGFVMACGADLALDATYCDEHVLDYSDENAAREYWSYPLDITGMYLRADRVSHCSVNVYVDQNNIPLDVVGWCDEKNYI